MMTGKWKKRWKHCTISQTRDPRINRPRIDLYEANRFSDYKKEIFDKCRIYLFDSYVKKVIMMLETWGVELARGIGLFFLNPLVYWEFILVILVGYKRIHAERLNFGVKLY